MLDKYGGRFDARQDLPSVVALGWLLLHAALRSRGILGAAGCAVVDHADLFDGGGADGGGAGGGGALGRKLAPLFDAPASILPAQRRPRETHVFVSSLDIELAKDCLDTYRIFREGAAVG